MTTSSPSPLSLSIPVISEIIEVLIIDVNSSIHDWFGYELIQRFNNINTKNITIKQMVNLFVDIIEPMFKPQFLEWLTEDYQLTNWNRLMINLKNQDYRKPISTMNRQTICGCDMCDNCPKISGIEDILSFWENLVDEMEKIENIDYNLFTTITSIHIDEIICPVMLHEDEYIQLKSDDIYYQRFPMED